MASEKAVSDQPEQLYQSSESSVDEVHELARQYTNLSRKLTNSSLGPIASHINPFAAPEDPRLDPYSEKFSPRAWARHVVNLHHRTENGYINRTAGVSFKDLGAFGYGTGSDYQKTVLNVLSSAVSSLASIGKKGTKIQILRNFNGVVKQGETCVVLGRPGRYVFDPVPQRLKSSL